jgi:hypothetical protein
VIRLLLIILLAYSQLGGLEGQALQEKSFWCFFLPAQLAKRSTKKDILGGLRPPQPLLASKPAGTY